MLVLRRWYLTRKVNAWAWEAYVPIGQTITYMTKVLEHTCFHNIKRGQQIQQKCDYTANLHTQSRSIIPFLQLCATRPQGSSMGSTLTVACLNCKQGGKKCISNRTYWLWIQFKVLLNRSKNFMHCDDYLTCLQDKLVNYRGYLSFEDSFAPLSNDTLIHKHNF